MNKYFFIFVVLLVLIIAACSKEGMSGVSGDKPPEVYIVIDDDKYETKLGTYCWTGGCADTVGPVELLKEKEPIIVTPGEKITFSMDYKPKPNEFYLVQINGNNESGVQIEENGFSAPIQKGVYYYSYGVWWMDEKNENVSYGDAFYAFVLEVK